MNVYQRIPPLPVSCLLCTVLASCGYTVWWEYRPADVERYGGVVLRDDSVATIVLRPDLRKYSNPPAVELIVSGAVAADVRDAAVELAVADDTAHAVPLVTTSVRARIMLPRGDQRRTSTVDRFASLPDAVKRIGDPTSRAVEYTYTYQPANFEVVDRLRARVRVVLERGGIPITIEHTLFIDKQSERHWWILRDC